MNKMFLKNIYALSAVTALAVNGFLAGAPKVSAQISAKNLMADLGPADLSSVSSNSFWTLLLIVIIFCVAYGIYYLINKKGK